MLVMYVCVSFLVCHFLVTLFISNGSLIHKGHFSTLLFANFFSVFTEQAGNSVQKRTLETVLLMNMNGNVYFVFFCKKQHNYTTLSGVNAQE